MTAKIVMTNKRSEAIDLAKQMVSSCHPKTPPPLSTALLAEVEARENVELMVRAMEEGAAEWEDRCKTAEAMVKELQLKNEIIKSELVTIAKQRTSDEYEDEEGEEIDINCMAEAYEITITRARHVLHYASQAKP